MNRKAKIVATIGPASQEEAVLERLVGAGMNVARLNFSHGTHEEHAAAHRFHPPGFRRGWASGRHPAGSAGTQDPGWRTACAAPACRKGEIVNLYATECHAARQATGRRSRWTSGSSSSSVRTSDRLLLDDGRLALEVVSVQGQCADRRGLWSADC